MAARRKRAAKTHAGGAKAPASKRGGNKERIIEALNTVLELELAGVVRYLHYSLMVFGHARIPIVKWMRDEATQSADHAAQAGEHVTALGGHPSLKIGKLLETHKHDISQILLEALEHEREGVAQYKKLLSLVQGKDVCLEEYARSLIHEETMHISEIEKMLRRPGDLEPAL
ncbi:MAG: ferritin-like domain-containing protein [Deltaproteobacteria bacterium]|nr:ferritin-like domain-containing protein [Deltaproteobacteria bacterium]